MRHRIVDAIGLACSMPAVLAIQTRKELDGAATLKKTIGLPVKTFFPRAA